MIKYFTALILVIVVGLSPFISNEDSKVSERENTVNSEIRIMFDEENESINIYSSVAETPILTHNVGEFFRPYIHPIVGPDGKGIFTENQPSHHPHQTGLFFGIPLINQRDFYHNPTGGGPWRGDRYWRRVSAEVLDSEKEDMVKWKTVYDLLDVYGEVMMTDTQIWSMQISEGTYLLDLEWIGGAKRDITIERWEYGGLFLRTPWRNTIQAEAVNSHGNSNSQAEGVRALWVNLGFEIEGRDDMGNIAIFDHKDNRGHPNAWRVDSQLGINPATARFGDWKIPNGESETIRYRVFIHTGDFNHDKVMSAFNHYIAD